MRWPKYQENTPGFLSDIATYSFNGNKLLTGGAWACNTQKETAEKKKHLSTTAKLHPWDYHHDVAGFNYRMPNLNATASNTVKVLMRYYLKA